MSFALQKLYDCISKGLGMVMIPNNVRSILEKQALQLEMLNGNEGTSNVLADLYYDEYLSETNTQKLYERTCSRFLYQEIKKQKNIENVINKTKDILEKEPENIISKENVDEDWIMRFFNSVQDISDEKMQEFWGKILAGEIKNPGSFSLRSLDAMTKMSKNEAKLFMNMSKYIIKINGNLVILNDEDLNKRFSITYGHIVALDEYGIIDSNTMMFLEFKINEKKDCKIIYDSQSLIAYSKEEKKIVIPIFKLTKIGKDIYKIAKGQVDNTYFHEVTKFLEKGNKDVSFSLYKIEN